MIEPGIPNCLSGRRTVHGEDEDDDTDDDRSLDEPEGYADDTVDDPAELVISGEESIEDGLEEEHKEEDEQEGVHGRACGLNMKLVPEDRPNIMHEPLSEKHRYDNGCYCNELSRGCVSKSQCTERNPRQQNNNVDDHGQAPSFAFSISCTTLPSNLPFNSFIASGMTLPKSFAEVAPVSVMMRWTIAAASSTVNCFGR